MVDIVNVDFEEHKIQDGQRDIEARFMVAGIKIKTYREIKKGNSILEATDQSGSGHVYGEIFSKL
jgi:hypothetical protein